jgi:hypothetical protein
MKTSAGHPFAVLTRKEPNMNLHPLTLQMVPRAL